MHRLLLVLCGGCSLAVTGPGPAPYRQPISCTTSHAAPTLDYLAASPILLMGIIMLAAGLSSHPNTPDQDGAIDTTGQGLKNDFLTFGSVFTAGGIGLIASGAHGSKLIDQCIAAKASAR